MYWFISLVGQESSKENIYTQAKEAIHKALEIDNNLSEAHATLGLIRWNHEWDWKGAEKSFKTALDLNPGSSKSHYDYAYYLALGKGSYDKSIPEVRKAIELDPLSGNAHYILGVSLFLSGRFDQAIEELLCAQEMIPNHIGSYTILPRVYEKNGMIEEAISEINKGLELFPKHPILLEGLGHIYAVKGEKEKARVILNELLQRSKKEYVSPVYIALLYAGLGQVDQTFEYLEKGYENQDIWLSYITIVMSLSDILHTNPRFPAFLKKIGLKD